MHCSPEEYETARSNTITFPDRIEKSFFTIRLTIVVVFNPLDRNRADGDFRQPGPWWSGKQLWIYLGESSDSLSGEEDQFRTCWAQKLTQTEWNFLFNGLQVQLLKNWPHNWDFSNIWGLCFQHFWIFFAKIYPVPSSSKQVLYRLLQHHFLPPCGRISSRGACLLLWPVHERIVVECRQL